MRVGGVTKKPAMKGGDKGRGKGASKAMKCGSKGKTEQTPNSERTPNKGGDGDGGEDDSKDNEDVQLRDAVKANKFFGCGMEKRSRVKPCRRTMSLFKGEGKTCGTTWRRL